ncbi:MAG: outer membrane lipoprotein chaperone LolA [Herminiimonas sp.]|nr:outer membrane lipoprotein chaperone LolA [Herminiimonas sp.]
MPDKGIPLKQSSVTHHQPGRVIATLLLAGALTLPSLALATALDQFKSFVSSTNGARGEFTQRLVKAEVKAPAKGDAAAAPQAKVSNPSAGTFLFARPGKFIWTYQKPYEQLLQADGDKLYIYDKDLNQVTVRKLGNALGSSPAAILFGSNDLEKNFTLKEIGQKGGLEWLEATPKAKDTTFDHIGIGFRNGLPEAMELRDSFGQVSLLTFTRFEKNPALAGEQFKFVVPKGADVFAN